MNELRESALQPHEAAFLARSRLKKPGFKKDLGPNTTSLEERSREVGKASNVVGPGNLLGPTSLLPWDSMYFWDLDI